jgi:dCMP deaminase
MITEYKHSPKWDLRFLALAKHVSTWSKDPSTQTGAVIVDAERRIVSVGYNGFAKGVNDAPKQYANRELKYKMIIHGEVNALLFAGRATLEGCTLYNWPLGPCAQCAAKFIQKGITRIVYPVNVNEDREKRWDEQVGLSIGMFDEAGVEVAPIDMSVVDLRLFLPNLLPS